MGDDVMLRCTNQRDEELARLLARAFQDRFHVGKVTRWLELAIEINAGNADQFPNEIAAALGVEGRDE